MKKIIVSIFVLFACIPSFGVCSIENSENSVCSLNTNLQERMPGLIQDNNSMTLQNPTLKPLKEENTMKQMKNTFNDDKFHKECQFGICFDDIKRKEGNNFNK